MLRSIPPSLLAQSENLFVDRASTTKRIAEVIPPPRKPSFLAWNGAVANHERFKQKKNKTGALAKKSSIVYEQPVYPSMPLNYSAGTLLESFLSIACDATGQFVAALSQYPNTVYLSQDYGTTYSSYFATYYYGDANAEFGSVVIASDAPNYIAFTGQYGIYVSNTTGASFGVVPSTTSVANWLDLAISSNGQYAYAIGTNSYYGEYGVLYASTDFAMSFAPLSGTTVIDYLSVATSSNGQYVFALTSQTAFCSTDYGKTFSIVFTLDYLIDISCSNSGQYVALATQNGYIYVSSSYGQGNWVKANIPSAFPSYPEYRPHWSSICLSSTGQKILAVGVDSLVYTSSNYGASFQPSLNSGAQYFVGSAISGNGQYMYAVSGQGYPFYSTDSGNIWAPLYYQWYGVASSQSGQYSIAVCTDIPAVYMTTNYGETWESLTSPFIAPFISFSAVACNSDCQYIALTCYENALVISSNYGVTWKQITFGSTDDDDLVAVAVTISSTGQYMTVVGDPGPIFISSDYGTTFTKVNGTHATFCTVSMSSNGQYQLAGSAQVSYGDDDPSVNYVYISTDYGQTWNMVSGLSEAQFWNAVSVDSSGMHLVAAEGYGGDIYYSNNSGMSWYPSIIPYQAANFVALCQSSSGQIVYAADGSGEELVYAGPIYMSVDYGATFKLTGSPLAEWSKLACDSTGQFVTATASAGQLYITSNGGMTWIPQNITVVSPYFNDDTSSSSDSSNSLSDGAIAGIVIASIIGIALIVALPTLFWLGLLPCCPHNTGTKAPLLNENNNL